MILTAIKRLYRTVVSFDDEQRQVLDSIRRASGGRPCRILDVGSGQGRYLRLLAGPGRSVRGVEINRALAAENRAAGLDCVTPEELQAAEQFDVLLISHVIEHFTPEGLLPLMDGYLDHLKPGGSLVIATPLMSPFFYDDFDHVKPYQPLGILMVFGGEGAQVQYYARNRLALRELWFRRSPWRASHHRARYFTGSATRGLQAVEFLAALMFRLSARRLGRTDGWVGLFEKTT